MFEKTTKPKARSAVWDVVIDIRFRFPDFTDPWRPCLWGCEGRYLSVRCGGWRICFWLAMNSHFVTNEPNKLLSCLYL